MPILEKRGVFWWSGEEIPEGAFAPQNAVQGLLTIGDDGRPFLDLDFMLNPSEKVFYTPEGPRSHPIIGVLRDSGDRVAISGVEIVGSNYSSNGIAYEKFRGWTCLIGSGPLTQSAEEAHFTEVKIRCDNYIEWFSERGAEVRELPGEISIVYRRPDDIVTQFALGTLRIGFTIDMSGLGHRSQSLEVRRHVDLTYTPAVAEGWKVVQDRMASLQEFLLLQTDALLNVDWPLVKIAGDEATYRFYYPSNRQSDDSYQERDCWVEFSQIRGDFGRIVEQFWERRVSAKSGYFMYTGYRRNPQATIEHKFVSLVWGLEALHRRRFSEPPQSERLVAKIARIVDAVCDRDKEWLKRQLSYSAEPNLSSRLSELIKGIPVEIDSEQFKKFCDRCAKVRNDISHFGMLSDYAEYHSSLAEILKLSRALAFCYHLTILLESGVSRAYIQSRVGHYMRIRHYHLMFEEYGIGAMPAD